MWNKTGQFSLLKVKGCGEDSSDSLFSAPIQGYMLGILSACLSALAVYTEFLMKKNNDSLYWHNVQLYTFGAIFNMARLVFDDFRDEFERGPWWQRLFTGYSFTTWMVVLNLGSCGLLISWIMKYADNIVKLFLGIIICMMSSHMCFAPPSMLVDLPPTVKSDPESLVNIPVDHKTDSWPSTSFPNDQWSAQIVSRRVLSAVIQVLNNGVDMWRRRFGV
ncbi:CMP-sialic acid transporter 1 [Hibiscus syriacus]|uniref:CMP-sialic acid transporter 1 n=1 Tax=Hibiscus syriacus TaxID=106335 RepID=A0A6A3C086_HIBSY|nr:CMP-sialic acid transporter 1 [Hibiscus syriacus]